jgi:hypothetical protein
MGARLEYIIIPLAFVFGTALVAMAGTNWGAKQYRRARRIAWTGGAIAAAACGAVGLFFALFPALWMGLFTGEEEATRIGTLYLHVVAPVYAAYGFGQALYFSSQGFGNPLPAVLANAARLLPRPAATKPRYNLQPLVAPSSARSSSGPVLWRKIPRVVTIMASSPLPNANFIRVSSCAPRSRSQVLPASLLR